MEIDYTKIAEVKEEREEQLLNAEDIDRDIALLNAALVNCYDSNYRISCILEDGFIDIFERFCRSLIRSWMKLFGKKEIK